MKIAVKCLIILVAVVFVALFASGKTEKNPAAQNIKVINPSEGTAENINPPADNTKPEAPRAEAGKKEDPPAITSDPQEEIKEIPDAEEFYKLAPTTGMTFEELVGDNGDYTPVREYPKAGTYKLVVNIYYQFVTVYTKDEKGEYTIPSRYMVCTTGRRGMSTPTGTFKMQKERLRFGKFVSYGVYGQYWSRVVRSIYMHSLLYTKRNAKYYTKSSYRDLGKRVSHGCIRLLVPDARWVYYNAAPGTVVQIIKGKKDPEMQAIKDRLTKAPLPSKRPNLKRGKIPVTEAWPGYTGTLSAPVFNQ